MAQILDAELVNGEVPAQVMPATWSDERPHELSKECWCHPLVEAVEARIVHRAAVPAK